MRDVVPNNPKCGICKHIPPFMEVETLHTEERLPKAVDRLEIIGGCSVDYALGQVRKCPKCTTYYLWFHDHDSESGTGFGYTDEQIERVTNERAHEILERNITSIDSSLRYYGKQAKDKGQHDVVRTSALERIEELKKEQERLKQERDLLK